MGKQPNNRRGVSFSPVRRGVGLGEGRARVRFCSQGGGSIREKLVKKEDFFQKSMISCTNPPSQEDLY